jgi:NADPH2:quinone reductase
MKTSTGTRRLVARVLRAGGPEVLRVEDEPLPPLGSGEVLLRVEAAGLNHVESLVRTGDYAIRFPFPYDAGIEGAGTVIDIAADVPIACGTRVCWTALPGSCATHVVAPSHMLAALPDLVSVEAGASIAHAAVAAAGLVRHCPLEAGSFAVVWGAAGAVGRILVALLADRGVRVIGIASGSRTDVVCRLGAEHVVDRARENVVDAVRNHTHSKGAAAVFDPVGAATYETTLKVLAPRGFLVNYGQLSGELPTIDLGQLMEAGSIFVTKYGPRAGLVGPGRLAAFIAEALALVSTRPIVSDIAARFPLDRIADAYQYLDANLPGKVLVLPHR